MWSKVTVMRLLEAHGLRESLAIDDVESKATVRMCSGLASFGAVLHDPRASQSAPGRELASKGNSMDATVWVAGSWNASSRTTLRDVLGLDWFALGFLSRKLSSTAVFWGMAVADEYVTLRPPLSLVQSPGRVHTVVPYLKDTERVAESVAAPVSPSSVMLGKHSACRSMSAVTVTTICVCVRENV